MGKRDFGRREAKKSKKDTQRILGVTALQPTETVEVIKKGRKEGKEVEEET